MNPLFERLMHEATQFTQNGRLQEATQAIQRALGAAAPAAGAGPDPAAQHRAAPAANDEGRVIDVEARVVERHPAPPATPEPAPPPGDPAEASEPSEPAE